jgi:hypothetical protein
MRLLGEKEILMSDIFDPHSQSLLEQFALAMAMRGYSDELSFGVSTFAFAHMNLVWC